MKKNQLDWLSWEWLIKVMFLLFFSIGTTHTTWAQSQLKITGNVVDTQGEPIIGASVVVKGTSNGTITDFEGNFQLNTKKKGSLVISRSSIIFTFIPSTRYLSVLLTRARILTCPRSSIRGLISVTFP